MQHRAATHCLRCHYCALCLGHGGKTASTSLCIVCCSLRITSPLMQSWLVWSRLTLQRHKSICVAKSISWHTLPFATCQTRKLSDMKCSQEYEDILSNRHVVRPLQYQQLVQYLSNMSNTVLTRTMTMVQAWAQTRMSST